MHRTVYPQQGKLSEKYLKIVAKNVEFQPSCSKLGHTYCIML